jgi:3',5'-cyclic-nucleotide phosphodiesterase
MSISLVLAAGSLATLRADNPVFDFIPLGTYGGLYEDNLSSYLLAPHDSTDFIALDAGTVMAGLARIDPVTLNNLTKRDDASLTRTGAMLRNHIKAYLISHAHLDHLAGLVVISPDDLQTGKDLLATDNTIKTIRENVFNWNVWPNFGNAGNAPALGSYHYVTLSPGEEVQQVGGTSMTAKAWPLDHSGANKSTAFLIGFKGSYALYFGDTGADEPGKAGQLQAIWTSIAPLVQQKALKGIFLEASYPDQPAGTNLFGHLTPTLVMAALGKLAEAVAILPAKPPFPAVSSMDALKGITLVVTHVKPTTAKEKEDPSAVIMGQLKTANKFGLILVRPQQGKMQSF